MKKLNPDSPYENDDNDHKLRSKDDNDQSEWVDDDKVGSIAASIKISKLQVGSKSKAI